MGILPRELPVVDAPGRQVNGEAGGGIALVECKPDIHGLLVDETPAVAVDDHRMGQHEVPGRGALHAAFVPVGQGADDERLVHVSQFGANRRRHAMPVAGVGGGAAGPLHRTGKMLRHQLGVPFEAARGEHHALADEETHRTGSARDLHAPNPSAGADEGLRGRPVPHRAACVETAFQQPDHERAAHRLLAGDEVPDELRAESEHPLSRMGDEGRVDQLLVAKPVAQRRRARTQLARPLPEDPYRQRRGRDVAAGPLAAGKLRVGVRFSVGNEAQGRMLFQEAEHARGVVDEGHPQRVLGVVPPGRRRGANVLERLLARVIHPDVGLVMVTGHPDVFRRTWWRSRRDARTSRPPPHRRRGSGR